MKKITLVLCACAMAFAGLLVSCSNDAPTGDYVRANEVSSNYIYKVSGSMSEVRTNGTTSTTDTYTIVKGTGEVWWSEDTQVTGDILSDNRQSYGIWVNSTCDEVFKGTSETKTYAVSHSLPFQSIYKFEEDYYIELSKGEYSKVTIEDGAFGDGEFTLKYEYTVDNGSTSSVTRTTKYSGTVKFSDATATEDAE